MTSGRATFSTSRIPTPHPVPAALLLTTALSALVILTSCGNDNIVGVIPGARAYVMGFTGFPHALSEDAVNKAWGVIKIDADLAVIHEDDGIPWQEALDGMPYPGPYMEWLKAIQRLIPAGHSVYLAVTPISESRDGLATNRGAAGSEPLPEPWNTYAFDKSYVIAAFTNHCLNMIEIYKPDYFAFAIEANALEILSPGKWAAFMTLTEKVYAGIKDIHPSLPIFATIQVEFYNGNLGSQTVAVSQLLDYCDIVAVSSYPFVLPYGDPSGDPGDILADYFTAFANLSPGKPFAIAETAWPAEPVDSPYIDYIPATELTQQEYVERLLADCDELSASFVCWFFTRDFDVSWESDFQYYQNADIIRLWRDCGLYDGVGDERPALTSWRSVLEN